MHYQVPRFTATPTAAAHTGTDRQDTTVTVTGVKSGDVVVFEPGSDPPDDIVLSSVRVTAANTVVLTTDKYSAGADTWTFGSSKFIVVNRFVNTSTA